MRPFSVVIALAAALAVSACIRTYKLDIQQGNVVTQEQLDQITPGMTKREVRYVLGTPLIVDPFRDDRWDYYYSLKAGPARQVNHRRVIIVFDGDTLVNIQGDVVPGQSDTESTEDDKAGGTKVTERQPDERGFFRRSWDKIFKD